MTTFLFMEMLTFGCPGALLAFLYPLYARLFSLKPAVANQVSIGRWTPKKMSIVFTVSDSVFFSLQVSFSRQYTIRKERA